MAIFKNFRRFVVWLLLALVVGVPIFLAVSFFYFGFDLKADVHDTLHASPDGAYVAAARDMDTGAVGSSSCVVLKSAEGQFPKFGFGDGVVADGPYGGFDVKWVGPRTLRILCGSDKALPGWKTRWRDVKIVYK